VRAESSLRLYSGLSWRPIDLNSAKETFASSGEVVAKFEALSVVVRTVLADAPLELAAREQR